MQRPAARAEIHHAGIARAHTEATATRRSGARSRRCAICWSLIVSNHGGRAEESGHATIDVLVEVVDSVGGNVPVLIDGGVHRSTDVMKALALGATAVGIGRPYVWGVASFGAAGADRVLETLDIEFSTIMRQVGALNLAQISRQNVSHA